MSYLLSASAELPSASADGAGTLLLFRDFSPEEWWAKAPAQRGFMDRWLKPTAIKKSISFP